MTLVLQRIADKYCLIFVGNPLIIIICDHKQCHVFCITLAVEVRYLVIFKISLVTTSTLYIKRESKNKRFQFEILLRLPLPLPLSL